MENITMTQGVNSVNSTGSKTGAKAARTEELTVRSGETLSSIAKRYKMSTKEFMDWTGLKSQSLQAGQKIKLPTDTVPSGKGLAALARKHGMSLDEFCKLNNITKDYKPSLGEKFYIKTKKNTEKTTEHQTVQQRPSTTPSKKTSQSAKPSSQANNNVPSASENQKKWGSPFTPEEIASTLEKEANDRWGAVGKKVFDDMLAQINSKNASAVIKAYNDGNYGQTLINRITHEVTSNEQKRKDAVMHIYDALAKEKNIPASKREEFLNELNARFDDWGMVNTKNLDNTIQQMIDTKATAAVTPAKSKSSKDTVKVIKGGFETAVGGQRKVSVTAAKPPIPVNEQGKVIAEVIKFSPSSSGPLSNYTIMVNAGHGWGGSTSEDATFKPGARYKDKNGKMLEEWYKNRNFADNLIEELTRNGATVVYTTGDAKQVCDAKEKYKADLLVSLHCNAVDNNTTANGLKIIYDGVDSKNSDRFAEIMNNQLQSQVNKKCAKMTAAQTQHKYLGLIDESNRRRIPALMLEMGFMSNPKDKLNIDSSSQRKLAMENVTIAIMKYFDVDPKNYNK